MNARQIYEEIERQAAALSTLATEPDERLFNKAEKVSRWSVADHLDHLALANQAMVRAIDHALEQGDDDARGGPTFIGRCVMLTGWIPRGKGKAPDFARPQLETSDELRRTLSEARAALGSLEERLLQIEAARGCSNHFAFGDLTPSQWLKVIEIHTRHHLKIIDAIERNRASQVGY